MSDTDNQNDDVDLEITDEDAERLLADAVEDDDSSDDTDDSGSASSRSDKDAAAQRELAKWKSLARKHERAHKDSSSKLRKYEDENKSEAQRLQEASEEHRTRAEKAESALRRREIAEDRAPAHATLAQIKAVAKRLSGDDDEALESDADELFGLLVPAPPKEAAPKTPQRPKERLRAGNADPENEEVEDDPRKLADMIRRNR